MKPTPAEPGGQQPIRILIADDQALFRDSLRTLLEAEPGFEVVGAAGDGLETLALIEPLQPDVLLLDLAMPRLPGLETLRELSTAPRAPRIILLTGAIEKDQIVEALQLGARGIVLKESATQLLLKCIRCVMAGEYWVGRESVSDLVACLRELSAEDREEKRKKTFDLTTRELEIVATVVTGASNKDIARRLSIGEDTVKHHLSNVFDKLGVSTRLELALFAVNHHLTD